MVNGANIRVVLRSLIISYILTGILLLVTAALLYRLEPEQSFVTAGILGIYVLCTFLGGLMAGKSIGNKKFLWGLVTGTAYFLLLLAASWMFAGGIQSGVNQIVTTMMLCLGGGMLGGMLA